MYITEILNYVALKIIVLLLKFVYEIIFSSTPRHGDCLQKKKTQTHLLEQKLDAGLERSLAAITSYVRHLLTTNQQRTDFKPINDDILIANTTIVSLF